MEFYEDRFAPVSPTGQYLNSSVLSLTIVAVLEFQVPIHDLQTFSLLKNMFIPINQRFSSIMVRTFLINLFFALIYSYDSTDLNSTI